MKYPLFSLSKYKVLNKNRKKNLRQVNDPPMKKGMDDTKKSILHHNAAIQAFVLIVKRSVLEGKTIVHRYGELENRFSISSLMMAVPAVAAVAVLLLVVMALVLAAVVLVVVVFPLAIAAFSAPEVRLGAVMALIVEIMMLLAIVAAILIPVVFAALVSMLLVPATIVVMTTSLLELEGFWKSYWLRLWYCNWGGRNGGCKSSSSNKSKELHGDVKRKSFISISKKIYIERMKD